MLSSYGETNNEHLLGEYWAYLREVEFLAALGGQKYEEALELNLMSLMNHFHKASSIAELPGGVDPSDLIPVFGEPASEIERRIRIIIFTFDLYRRLIPQIWGGETRKGCTIFDFLKLRLTLRGD